jgi:hypothetical protein
MYSIRTKKRTFIVYVAVIASALILSTISAFANELSITNKNVDSNTWTYVGYATKSTTSSYATVKITKLLTANGSASLYTLLKVKATSTGTSYTVTLGVNTDIPIPSGSRAAGTAVGYYCMGNNPALDCKASGYFNSH